MNTFTRNLAFNPEKHLFVGVERECFLTRDRIIVPIAGEIIPQLDNKRNFGYELSACQLEIRTDPTRIGEIKSALKYSQQLLSGYENAFGFKALHQEVAPYEIPLDVYPDPTGRYQEITRDMPIKKLRAACRVAGTHVHIGMGSKELAIRAYNAAIKELSKLAKLGDKSQGERLQIYKIMAPDCKPPHYENWEYFEQYAKNHGFNENPRNCWHLIRISIHGTIEFRVFGATPSVDEIDRWARLCHSICQNAL